MKQKNEEDRDREPFSCVKKIEIGLFIIYLGYLKILIIIKNFDNKTKKELYLPIEIVKSKFGGFVITNFIKYVFFIFFSLSQTQLTLKNLFSEIFLTK